MDVLFWGLGGALILLVLYIVGNWNFKFFSSKGIKSCETVPFLGSMHKIIFARTSSAIVFNDMCKKFPKLRYFGLFVFQKPVVIVKDPDLIKRITVKDFDHFVDRQQAISDPLLARSLSVLRGQRWHEMRATLSPVFTSSKIKNMFHLMNQCGKQLCDYLQEETDKDPGKPLTLEMKDLSTRYTNDVIATAAFGIQVDSLKEKSNSFYTMGRQITNFQGIRLLTKLGYTLVPKLMEFLGISFFSKTESNFFYDLVRDTISTREREGIVRPDMIHLLMQTRKGELKTEEGDEEEAPKAKRIQLTEDEIVAQAMIFFFAGFETGSVLLSFISLLLAVHEDVQRRLQDEIDEVVGDGNVTYDKVLKMKYLEMVVLETLRIYPPAMVLDRLCTKEFVIPANQDEPEHTVKKGEGIWIPVYALHHNPEYFPNPDKFDPERFNEENKHNIQPYTYLPFGVGPRFCIGQRFALMETKVALIHILSRFNFVVVEKTPLPLKLARKTFIMAIQGGYWVGVTPRSNSLI